MEGFAQLPGPDIWTVDEEVAELVKLAEGKIVLEVGAYWGRSTVAMAKVARQVIVVDNFVGCQAGTDDRISVRKQFFDNIREHDVESKVLTFVGPLESVLPKLNLAGVDLVFYDADHNYQSTLTGACQLLTSGLRPQATIAFHDYGWTDRGVIQAVDTFSRMTGRKFRLARTVAIFDGVESNEPPAKPRHKVVLCFPYNGKIDYEAAQGLFRASSQLDVQILPHCSSALAGCFNYLLSAALNMYDKGEVTHMAFLHADIEMQDQWVDILLDEMDRTGADFVSGVNAIKDARGLTSTGVSRLDDPWNCFRRFTVKELAKLPATFNAESAGYPGYVLLHNTGCWVADLRSPVFHQVDEKGCNRFFFTQNDAVERKDGKWHILFEPEDWFCSRRLHELGAKSYATSKVKTGHIGQIRYDNFGDWGLFQNGDENTKPLWGAESNPPLVTSDRVSEA